MATYPVVNTKTGEQKEVMMSITEWDQWCKDNPDSVSYTHLTLPTILRV